MGQSYDTQDLSQMGTSRNMSFNSLSVCLQLLPKLLNVGLAARRTSHETSRTFILSLVFLWSGPGVFETRTPRMLVSGSTRQQLPWESFSRCFELIGDQLETAALQERHDLCSFNPKNIPVGQ